MKKIIISAITLVIISLGSAYATVDVNECDKLETKAKKIDCLTALKAKAVKEQALEPIKNISKKINSLNEKKKIFDENNKTLWDMFKKT